MSGTVTGEFRGEDRMRGFFLQSRPESRHALPVAGFVFLPEPDAGWDEPIPGSRVVVRGEASEHRGQRQISWVDSIEHCAEPGLPDPVRVSLPTQERSAWERLEGVYVRIAKPLTVVDNFHLARYGSLDLVSGPRPIHGNAAAAEPGRQLVLDDGSYAREPRPVPFLNEAGTRRLGSRIDRLTGVLTHAFGAWRIHPVKPKAVRFRQTNPRPEAPQPPAGTTRLVGFNVNNYFVTMGDRGAATGDEQQQQRSRLQAVAEQLRPAVLGLNEIENSAAAVADIARRLGEAATGEPYRHIEQGDRLGADDIRSALLWDPARVEHLAGPFVDDAEAHKRPPLAALLRLYDDDPGTLVVVAHFKSRGSCPGSGDVDRGAGCWNQARSAQARALAEFIRNTRAELDTDRVVLLGDLNAYPGERPRTLLHEEAELINLLGELAEEERYTYVYQGVAGNLDVAFGTQTVAADVAQARIWHINADEPNSLNEFSETDGPWRSSDHDPVIIDLAPTR